jgi:hypothetical protein
VAFRPIRSPPADIGAAGVPAGHECGVDSAALFALGDIGGHATSVPA